VALRSQTLHILLAGRDTTAGLLSWVFYFLVRDDRVLKKLQSTILTDFGTYSHPVDITFARLKGCKYLQYCINEALRLCPLVPFNVRLSVRDTTLPRGGGLDGTSPIFVPEETAVDYSVYAMHHDKDIWGDTGEDFHPERFEGRKASWEFLPFNGGPRICIGRKSAFFRLCPRS
jgi:cytochrome P450